MSGDLISRDDVLRVFYNKEPVVQGEHDGMGMLAYALWRHIREAVEAIPTVEAEPVVHARWRWGRNSMNQYGAWCTECECGWEDKGDNFDRVQGLVIAHKYCPNCGAHMDEEV